MIEMIFLIVLGIIWLVWASFQDLKKREVDNWIGFSLIIFAIGFRFFYSFFSTDVGWNFFYSGLIGLGIFFVLGNLFYYSRVFAGGDAKLMIALGSILGISGIFFMDLRIYILFLILFLFVGAIYGLIWSIFLSVRYWEVFSKDFYKRVKKHTWRGIVVLIFVSTFIVLGIFSKVFLVTYFGILIFLFYLLLFFAKSVDEVCMIKRISIGNLTIGDWLYKDLRIGKNKIVKAGWEGLSEKEIKILKKKFGNKKKILIRQGIPYIPVFLISYLALICIWFFYREFLLGLF
ncbi:MAG: prepilin peptidase [Nanoarchaeota archaeon]